MNYEDMSDHEINMAVTYIDNDCQGWSVAESNSGFYHCGIDGSGFYEVECADYCDIKTKAWPIIIENEISIQPELSGRWKAITSRDGKVGAVGVSEKPLRAAMICFLKMKDSEQWTQKHYP